MSRPRSIPSTAGVCAAVLVGAAIAAPDSSVASGTGQLSVEVVRVPQHLTGRAGVRVSGPVGSIHPTQQRVRPGQTLGALLPGLYLVRVRAVTTAKGRHLVAVPAVRWVSVGPGATSRLRLGFTVVDPGMREITAKIGMTGACRRLFDDPGASAEYRDVTDPTSWFCVSSAGTDLGGGDLNRYCRMLSFDNALLHGRTADAWYCAKSSEREESHH